MNSLFNMVIVLGITGSAVCCVLFCLKPLMSRFLHAKFQLALWFCAALCMIFPLYKLVPESDFSIVPTQPSRMLVYEEENAPNFEPELSENVSSENTVKPHAEIEIERGTDFYSIAVIIWISGIAVYLSSVFVSYFVYIHRLNKKSVPVGENCSFEAAKNTLGIKRRISLRKMTDNRSPVLVGIVFPTIYMPCIDIENGRQLMIFIHELMHFRRRDLVVKWICIFVRAVHWYNPFAYYIGKNVSDLCEIACDMAVTEKMTDEERTAYMNTIIDMIRN